MEINGESVSVSHVRDVRFGEWEKADSEVLLAGDPSPFHFAANYDLRQLRQLWLGFTPTHAFLCFRFCDAEPGAQTLTVGLEHRHAHVDAPPLTVMGQLLGDFQAYGSIATLRDALTRGWYSNSGEGAFRLFPINYLAAEQDEEARSHRRREAFVNAAHQIDDLIEDRKSYSSLFRSCATFCMGVANATVGQELTWFEGFRYFVRHFTTDLQGLQEWAVDRGFVESDGRDTTALLEHYRVDRTIAELHADPEHPANGHGLEAADRFAEIICDRL